MNMRIAAGATVAYVVGESANERDRAGLSTERGHAGRGGAIRITYTVPIPAAPNFSDDTGDAAWWTSGEAITPIVVPRATGNPAPVYAVVGALPSGIAFNAATRTFTGTPVGRPSGTLRVRATNSQGFDDWTVAYSTNPAPPAGVLRTTIGDLGTGSRLRWNPDTGVLIPATLVQGGGVAYLLDFNGNTYSGGGRDHADINLGVSAQNSGSSFAAGPELTPRWEGYENAITIEAGGRKASLPGPNHSSSTRRDTTEPYFWNLGSAKATEWKNFVNFYRGLSQDARDATRIELRDRSPEVRLMSRLVVRGTGRSEAQVTTPDAVRLASRLVVTGTGRSEAQVTAPEAVRLASRLVVRGTGRSEVFVDQQPFEDVVRLASRLVVRGTGRSEAQVTAPEAVRLASRLVVQGTGRSEAQVAPPAAVRLASRLVVIGTGRSEVFSAFNPGAAQDRRIVAARGLHGVDEKYAVEITHPALMESIRHIADTVEHTIDAQTYTPLIFEAVPPQEVDGEIRRATLRLDNVGEELTELVHDTEGARGATMRVMRVVPPSFFERDSYVSWEVTMDVGVTELTNEFVAINLTDEPVYGRPAITLRHDPATSPGLF